MTIAIRQLHPLFAGEVDRLATSRSELAAVPHALKAANAISAAATVHARFIAHPPVEWRDHPRPN